jgi:predicted metallopeptidase
MRPRSGSSRPRPNATLLCRRLVADMARILPELSHVDAARILFVAGEARRASRATVKALGRKGRPEVRLSGLRALYCITLRPKFFRASTPEQRLATLLHELLHISPRFDGSLHEGHRHGAISNPRFAALLAPLVQRYLEAGDKALLALLAHDGEVLARQWLERPTGKGGRALYTERELFVGPVQMLTPRRGLH